MLSTAQGHSFVPLSHVPTPQIPPRRSLGAAGTGRAAGRKPHTRPSLTSLPQCHSRCRAAGKPASASIRAFTSPTSAEGGSSNVLQPRQPWRMVTRASLRQHRERHCLRSAAPTPTRSASRPGGPRRPPELPVGVRGGAAGPRGEAVAAPAARPRPVPSRPAATHMPAAHKGPLAAAAAPHTGKGRDRAAAGGRGSPGALRREGRGRRRRKQSWWGRRPKSSGGCRGGANGAVPLRVPSSTQGGAGT